MCNFLHNGVPADKIPTVAERRAVPLRQPSLMHKTDIVNGFNSGLQHYNKV